jgi:hypothetical protein
MYNIQQRLLKTIAVSIFLSSFCSIILSEINQNERESPEKYIKKAIKLFKYRKGTVIVEIGSMRCPISHPIGKGHCGGCMDGHSTLWWATTGARVYSIDISKQNIEVTRDACKNFKNVHAIVQDGITFLKSFKQSIDLLFLDAWDAIEETPYAENHLEAYSAAKPHLHAKSLILIDDTDIKDCGKGRLVIPQAIKDGYQIIFSGRQTLLAKKK